MKLRLAFVLLGLLSGGCAAVPADPAPVTAEIDYSCRVDSDCTIKDVGSCCGYRPACVNVDSATFPERVRASCAKGGAVSICGYPEIQSCRCVSNTCAAQEPMP